MTEAVVKVCRVCGKDVSQSKRTKDAQGKYYCNPCYGARANAHTAPVASPPLHPAAVDADAASADDRLAPTEKRIIAVGSVVGVLVVAGLLYFLVFRDKWENDHAEQLTSLITDAHSLAQRKDWDAARTKYSQAFGLLEGHSIRDDRLQAILATARSDAADVDRSIEAEQRRLRVAQEAVTQRQRDDHPGGQATPALQRQAEGDAVVVEVERQRGAAPDDLAARDAAVKAKVTQAAEAKQAAEAEARHKEAASFDAARSEIAAMMETGKFVKPFAEAKTLVNKHPGHLECLQLLERAAAGVVSSIPFKEVQGFNAHTTQVVAVCVSSDGSRLATSSLANEVAVWDVKSHRQIRAWSFGEIAKNVAFAVDGASLWLGFNSQRFVQLDINTGKQLRKFNHPNSLSSYGHEPMAMSRSGAFLVSSGLGTPHRWTMGSTTYEEAYPVLVYHLETGRLAATMIGHYAAPECVAFSSDEKLLASGQKGGRIIIWDKAKGEPLRTLDATREAPDACFQNVTAALQFTSDGQRLIAAGDNQIRVFDVSTGRCLSTIRDIGKSADQLVLSADEQLAIIRSGDVACLMVYRLRDGKRLQSLRPADSAVSSLDGHLVEMSKDGQTIYAGGADGSVKVWEVEPTSELQTEAVKVIRRLRAVREEKLDKVLGAGGAELAWLDAAISGRAEAEEQARIEARADEQATLLAQSRRRAAERRQAKEVAPGTPRAIASGLLDPLVAGGTLKSYEFINYFQVGGFKQWDALPEDATRICIRFKFVFVSKAGVLREHPGYVVCQKNGGWEATVVNIDGSDVPAAVLRKGGFIFR